MGAPIEIRNLDTGELIGSYTPEGTILGIALTGRRVAALVEADTGRKYIEVTRTRSGRRILRTRVPRNTRLPIDVSGKRVVFRAGNTIRVLDLRTKAKSRIALSRSRVTGLTIDGRRVFWAQNNRPGSRIRMLTLPRRPL